MSVWPATRCVDGVAIFSRSFNNGTNTLQIARTRMGRPLFFPSWTLCSSLLTLHAKATDISDEEADSLLNTLMFGETDPLFTDWSVSSDAISLPFAIGTPRSPIIPSPGSHRTPQSEWLAELHNLRSKDLQTSHNNWSHDDFHRSPSRFLTQRVALCALPTFENLSLPIAPTTPTVGATERSPAPLLTSPGFPPIFNIPQDSENAFAFGQPLYNPWLLPGTYVSPIVRASETGVRLPEQLASTPGSLRPSSKKTSFMERLLRQPSSSVEDAQVTTDVGLRSPPRLETPTSTPKWDFSSVTSASTPSTVTPKRLGYMSPSSPLTPLTSPLAPPGQDDIVTKMRLRKRKSAPPNSWALPEPRIKKRRSRRESTADSHPDPAPRDHPKAASRSIPITTGPPEYTTRKPCSTRDIEISPDFPLFYRRFPASSYFQPSGARCDDYQSSSSPLTWRFQAPRVNCLKFSIPVVTTTPLALLLTCTLRGSSRAKERKRLVCVPYVLNLRIAEGKIKNSGWL